MKTTRINITVAYEDFAASKRAKGLLDRVPQLMGDKTLVERRMWKFDVLCVPALQRMAVDDAAAANLIIIASTNPTEPPAFVREWIEQWVHQQARGRRALVSLTEIGSGDQTVQPAVSAYCARMAGQAGMDFLCDQVPRSDGDVEFSDHDGELVARRLSSLMGQIIRERAGSGRATALKPEVPAGDRSSTFRSPPACRS